MNPKLEHDKRQRAMILIRRGIELFPPDESIGDIATALADEADNLLSEALGADGASGFWCRWIKETTGRPVKIIRHIERP